MNPDPGKKFIIAVPVCETLDETWRILDGYMELRPGGFMVGVGGRLPVLAPAGQPGMVDHQRLCDFIDLLKRRYPGTFAAVDAEGGDIFNILQGASPLRSARNYTGFLSDAELRERFEADLEAHVELLAQAGADINFAPLLDVPLPGYRGYAAGDRRCISDDPGEVIAFGRSFIAAHRRRGIICTAKHFPGYGHLKENPHQLLSVEADAWDDKRALEPYSALCSEGSLQAVMLGHCTTPKHPRVPATLASQALELLRNELHFDGLAVADELFMGAVNDYYRDPLSGRSDGDPDGERRAVDAWSLCDLIIVSYPIQNRDGTVMGRPGGERRLPTMVGAVRMALEDGRIPAASWKDSLRRLSAAGLLS
jgi:beta-N-acetylhexosaminidase